jgi:hypothetical protein
MGVKAASGRNSERHLFSASYSYCGLRMPRQKEVMGERMGFSLGFGGDFAVWVLISGLRVLSDSGGL